MTRSRVRDDQRMEGVIGFGGIIGIVGAAIIVAVLSNRLSAWVRVPAPAIFLVAAAVVSDVFPQLGRASVITVERVVTVALIFVLFDGGMHIGWRRFRSAAASVTWSGVGSGLLEFTVQMLVGAGVGIAGGLALAWFMRVPLPNGALYPLRTLGAAAAIYGAATVAHGSGFLAVFVAGILVGDVRAPYKAEVRRFSASLASLGEIIAFTILGLTVSLGSLVDSDALWVGLAIAVLLTFLVRPLLVGALLLPVRLRLGERIFVLWAGLKGAVPILLGTFVLASQVPAALRIYQIVVVVVAFSVVVQGGLVPFVARRCGVPMRTVEPEPWSLVVRFRHEPHGLQRHVVERGSPADQSTIAALELGEDAWISFVRREGRLVQVRGETMLRAGDEVLVLADPVDGDRIGELFAPTG